MGKATERILLVDDEKEFVEALAERMQSRGIAVSTATSARDGIKLAQQQVYDAVVLDLQMPEMDGIETLKALKESNPNLQVILLTGHATVEKGIQAMKLGAMDFIEKPAELAVIIEKIKEARARRMILVEKDNENMIKDILAGKSW